MSTENAAPAAASPAPAAAPATAPAAAVTTEAPKPASAAVVTPAPAAAAPAPGTAEPTTKPGEEPKKGDAPDPEKGKKSEQPVVEVIPEKYDFKAPEGVEVESALVEQLSTLAKEGKMSQATADKFFQLGIAQAKAIQEKQEAAWQATKSGWKADTLKELGPNAEEQLAYVAKARTRLFDKDFGDLMDQSGFGENPIVIRNIIRLGKSISEETHVIGQNKEGKSASAKDLFPSMPSA